MDKKQRHIQLIWGLALASAGVGVFLLLPRRMEQIRQLRQAEAYSLDMLFLWFCFGLLGVLLVGGGLRKVYGYFKGPPDYADGNQDRD
jgi:hypothetical protein